MTECIAKCNEVVGISGKTLMVPDYIDTSKEIVRCRDCRYYQVVDEIFDGEDDTAIYGCELLEWKGASYCYEEPTDPNGFCAWGELKGGAK